MTGTIEPRPVGPRTLAQRAAVADRMRAAVRQDPPARFGLTVADPHARLALVELDGRFVVDQVLESGYGACTYLFGWDVHRQPIETPALARFHGGYGDLVLRPDLAAPIPVGADTWWVPCDAAWPDGAAVDVAPRTVLRDQLVAAEELGLVPSIGLEHEITFYAADGRPLSAGGLDYSLDGVESMAPILTEVTATLRRAGLGVESARGECHPGQYEIVLRHRDALTACDDALFQQALTRQAARRCGARASYLAAEAPEQGSSCHVHLSLADPAGTPVDADTLAAFLAGVLRAAGDLTAIWAPTINGHVRLRTGPFSPRAVRWGVDDRTAAVRMVGHARNRRLECRFAGADAQPHLVVAALLAAGLAGVRESRVPPPAGATVDELCGTPWESLARLRGSGLAEKLLGTAVVEHQAALLGAELEQWCDGVTDWQRHRGELRA